METTYSIKNFAMRMVFAVVLLCVIGVGSVWGTKITNYSDIESGKTYYIGATTSSTDYYLSVDGSALTNSIAGTAVTAKANATQFVFTGSGTSWTIKFADGSYYLGIKGSKDNGKLQVVESAFTFAASNQSELLRLAHPTASYAIEKNSSGMQFGSYGYTGTDIWLEEVSSTFTVTYSDNDATSGTAPTDNTAYSSSNNTVTVLGNTGNLSKTGFVFSGWNTEANGSGTTYSPSNTFTISTDVTLYAYWLGARYNLLTDIDDLEEDDEIIIVNTGVSYAISTTQGANNRGASNYLITNQDKTTVTLTGSSVQSLIVGKVGDYWTFYTGEGYLCAPGNSSNYYLKTAANSSDNNSHWSIELNEDNEASIVAQGSNTNTVMQYNTSVLFACYSSASQTALKIYYKKARQLTFFRTKCYREFTDAEDDGKWSTEGNWTNSHLPSINDLAKINKPVTVDMDNPTAMAKNVVIYNDGSTHTGQLIIDAGKELVVAGTVHKTTDGSNYTATGENDIVINSTSGAGLGALVMGTHDGTNKATVNFYSKSHGAKNSNESVNQFVGTPFNDETNVLYNWYNSWIYEFTNTSGTPSWKRLHDGDGMTPFHGYCIISAENEQNPGHMYWQQGTLVASGDQSLMLAYYNSENTENMFANSWMAPIKISEMIGHMPNTTATIYIFNSGSPSQGSGGSGDTPGNYSSYTSGTAGSNVIPAMQAFTVYANAAGSLNLDYSAYVYDPAVAGTTPVANKAPQRTGAADEMEHLKLRVASESGWGDALDIYIREDFSYGFELYYDGPKIEGDDLAPLLYAVTDDGKMAINCVPDVEGTVVGFRRGEDAYYLFTFDYEGEEVLYLNDLKEQVSTPISADMSYQFYSAAEDMQTRFIISRTPIRNTPTGVEDNADNASIVRKIVIDDHVFIIRNGQMYDVTGKRVTDINK